MSVSHESATKASKNTSKNKWLRLIRRTEALLDQATQDKARLEYALRAYKSNLRKGVIFPPPVKVSELTGRPTR